MKVIVWFDQDTFWDSQLSLTSQPFGNLSTRRERKVGVLKPLI